jgi:NADH-quinone oxidoreductase subunit D
VVLDLFELITGLRMNHAYIRPGGVAQDLPPGAIEDPRLPGRCRRSCKEYEACCNGNPDLARPALQGVGYLDLAGCMALGITGPVLRSTGLPHGPAQDQPYCGYETYDFDVPTATPATRTAATSSGWRRCASRCDRRAVPGPAGARAR